MKYEQPTMDIDMWRKIDIITTSDTDPDLDGWDSGSGGNINPYNNSDSY